MPLPKDVGYNTNARATLLCMVYSSCSGCSRRTRTGDSGTLSALIARGHSPVASRASHAAKYRSRLNGTDESLPSTRRVSPCLSVQACHLKRLMQTFRLMYGI